MADLPSSFSYVNDVENAEGSLVAESKFLKLGSNDNFIKDTIDQEITDRTAADVVLANQVTDITNEINSNVILAKVQVRQGAFSVAGTFLQPPVTNIVPETNFNPGAAFRVFQVWAEKRNGGNLTYIKIQLFIDDGDYTRADFYVLVSGLGHNDWDTFHWYHDYDAKQINFRFYNNLTLSI